MDGKAPANRDDRTVASFGDEWERFDQSELPEAESRAIFEKYFALFPWESLPRDAVGFDMGCGSGRWARWVAPRVGTLHCIDPSSALAVARRNLAGHDNVAFHAHGVDDAPLAPGSQDFGYSLGVLHHLPDTAAALARTALLLKPGAPFQLYLYYAFDNRSLLFRMIWRASDLVRRVVSSLPPGPKHFAADLMAVTVYFPLARTAWLLGKLGLPVGWIPLAFYRDKSFYTMRTDSRDRFGTPLEHRFTRREIEEMMKAAGLGEIRFTDSEPYWCAVGRKL
jgi:SAM-dependent methyltransferase